MSDTWEIFGLEKFDEMATDIGLTLLAAPSYSVGTWQSQDVSSRPEMATRELTNVMLKIGPILEFQPKLVQEIHPSIPWAEDHFQERISGQPLNPPPSEAYWPYAQRGNAEHKKDQKFSHTYPERFWPKFAGDPQTWDISGPEAKANYGLRYRYGDLADVITHLNSSPGSRQAYLPVWFPEDTGVVHGERVPCTLGYQFLHRGGYLDITYFIRSCDYMRHWRDDVYMASRLLQWVSSQLDYRPIPRNLIMNITSFHIFEGDVELLKSELQQKQMVNRAKQSSKLLEAFS